MPAARVSSEIPWLIPEATKNCATSTTKPSTAPIDAAVRYARRALLPNTMLTNTLGPLGPLMALGGIGLALILATLPTMLKKKADPFQRVKDLRDAAMAVPKAKGGDLEAKYEKLRGEYEDARKRADTVHEKIKAVRNVASGRGTMFQAREWMAELEAVR